MKAMRLAGTFAVVVASAAACTGTGPTAPVPSTAIVATSACSYATRRDVLPEWARTGFSDPSPSGIPFVLGDAGRILGVIFGYPLTAPPPTEGRANKILWVAGPIVDPPSANGDTAASADLKIDAQLAGSTEVVHREVAGGPGPSIVDMPRPGCWHLTLTWSNRTDTLDLWYEARSD